MRVLFLCVFLSLLPFTIFGQDCNPPCPNITCPNNAAPVCTNSGNWVCPCTTGGYGTCYDYTDCGGEGYSCVDGCCLYGSGCEAGACLSASDCGTDSEDWSCSDGCCVYNGGGTGNDPCPPNSGDCGTGCVLDSDCSYGEFCNPDYWTDRDDPPPPVPYCDYEGDPDYPCYGWCDANDPIILDLTGAGYFLTSAANGVPLNIPGGKKPVQFAWTTPNPTDGWLVMDVNGNGQIDGAGEMFGNLMPVPSGVSHTGFGALAQYDLPANGGNGDGIIDARDAVYSRLRVWVDANHNGIAEPGELFTLQQLGIQSISLKTQAENWTDAYGNKFRYRAKITFAGNGQGQDHWAYDVVLMAAK